MAPTPNVGKVFDGVITAMPAEGASAGAVHGAAGPLATAGAFSAKVSSASATGSRPSHNRRFCSEPARATSAATFGDALKSHVAVQFTPSGLVTASTGSNVSVAWVRASALVSARRPLMAKGFLLEAMRRASIEFSASGPPVTRSRA